ncbi:MAG: YdcF family protein [Novosphingobium sp.]|nr:YdcF family protein [Novosphingobium sp.]MCC2096049.1 YdcF family protein [Hyphomicrobiales bacterium]
MFFYLSKIFWFVSAPVNVLMFAFVLGSIALALRWLRIGRALVFAATAGYVIIGFLPFHVWLLRPLEDRFSRPDLTGKEIAGIIVLGGAVDPYITATRGVTQLVLGAPRMTEAVALARRFPKARLVFTGGSAALLGSPYTEASVAEALFKSLGVDGSRLVMESRSRNTYENAIYTRDLIKPRPGETWLLVTSAYHMPRSAGIFRKANFAVVPYPVDYRTRGTTREYWAPLRNVSEGLRYTDIAVREWVGLIAYYMTGKTAALLPGPS